MPNLTHVALYHSAEAASDICCHATRTILQTTANAACTLEPAVTAVGACETSTWSCLGRSRVHACNQQQEHCQMTMAVAPGILLVPDICVGCEATGTVDVQDCGIRNSVQQPARQVGAACIGGMHTGTEH